MEKSIRNDQFLEELTRKFKKEMPRIQKEISVYEDRLKKGKLNPSPKIAPQFNR